MFRKQSPVRAKNKPKPQRRLIDPHKRMLLRQLLVGLGIFSLVGFIVTGLWYGTRIDRLTLTEVTVRGGETISPQLVQAAAQSALEGNYIGIIPRRFAWWYPAENIYTNVMKIPRIKNLQISRISGTVLEISYDEYLPYALWCAERTSETCLFFDAAGYAFDVAPRLIGGAFIRYRTLGKEAAVGSMIAEREQLEQIEIFIELLSVGLHFDVAAVETDISGDVFYILSAGGELKTTLRDPAVVVYENLKTILGSKEFVHIKPGNFQYIDLRFGNKVFVNETSPEIATSTASSSVPLPPPKP
jgi:hypothetical protein